MQTNSTFSTKIAPLLITLVSSITFSICTYYITSDYEGWPTDFLIWTHPLLLFFGGTIYATTLLPWIINTTKHIHKNFWRILAWFILSATSYFVGILLTFFNAMLPFLASFFAGAISSLFLWFGFYMLGFKTKQKSWFWFIFISGTLALTFMLFSAFSTDFSYSELFAKSIIPSIGLIVWPTVVTYMILQRFDFTKSSTRSV
jgi:hypothetical protein